MKGIAATVGVDGRRDFFWLDREFGMSASSPLRGLGFNLNFGGIFTSVPVAVAAMARHDLLVLEKTAVAAKAEAAGVANVGPLAGSAVAAGHSAGGTVVSGLIPAGGHAGGLLPLTQRIDLFGLGLDYAMYHKRIWGSFDQNDASPWRRLDGIFTSAPAAVAWQNRVDVFGLGTDHAMYTKTANGDTWTAEWQRLGGTFTSAASLVLLGTKELHLFARGADYTLRGNHTDGTTWFGFQSYGGELASAPVAVSWGPERIDLFAIFNDGALWHRWWDGQIWNDWESLGGSYAGEPAAVSWAPGRLDVFVLGATDRQLYHHWFSNDTWSHPAVVNIGTLEGLAESPTVISAAPNRLEVFVPTNADQIRIVTWDGDAWQPGAAGATLRMPSRYRLSVDFIDAKNPRSLNADTDAAVASLKAGNAAVQTKLQWIGDIGGTHPSQTHTNRLAFESVTVDLAEPMCLNYLVVNNGHAPQDKILAALASGSNSLSLSGSSSMQEDIGKGVAKILSVTLTGAINVTIPVVGSVLNAVEDWLLGKLTDVIFASCDGVVAVEFHAMMGADLFRLTDNGKKTVRVTTLHAGTESDSGCGGNSVYEVIWTIKPL